VDLLRILSRELTCLLSATAKEQALLELIDLISGTGRVQDIENLRKSIFYREELMSTGIGLGIAVPHVRIEGVTDPVVAVGICPEGISDYESIDDELVRIVVMIVAGKQQHKTYIKLLAGIVERLKTGNVIDRLCASRDPEEIYRILAGQNHA
jgi:mannitol/fructose-specific phosphotransferase system IIA component (Ntr-type)